MSEAEETKTGKKKHNPLLVFLKFILILLLAIIIAFAAWVAFSALDKKDSLSVIPNDFAAYVRTDHLWKTVNPLVDLKALDVFLTDPKYGEVRNAVVNFRSSDLRNKKYVAFALDRRIDGTYYTDGSFCVAVNLGPLSAATRLAPLVVPKLSIKKLSFITKEGVSYFEYNDGKITIYAKPYHNLLLVSSSEKLFKKMCAANCLDEYSAERKTQLKEKMNSPLRIACDVNTVLALDETVQNRYAPLIKPLLKQDTLAFVGTSIADEKMHLKLTLPLKKLNDENLNEVKSNTKLSNAILNVAKNNSTQSALLFNMPDCVQYYTLLNLAPLEQMYNLALPFIPNSQNVSSTLQTAETFTNMLFGLSVEDILFSWTGKELAVLGLEGKKDPVFAVQITDEEKRQNVFSKVFSSFLLNEQDSLLLDGERIPRIELPQVFQALFKQFKINVIKPYYFVSDGFVYFSESAENLIQLASSSGIDTLDQTGKFKDVSSLQKDETSLSIYYNLLRSIPFFLKSNTSVSKALQLYNIGRADVRIERNGEGEGNLFITLQAISNEAKNENEIAGYPLNLDGAKNEQLCRNNLKKPNFFFWVQDENKIQFYNADTSATSSFECKNKVFVIPTSKGEQNILWAVTTTGEIYLFNKDFSLVQNYPVKIEAAVSVKPALFENKLLVVSNDKNFYLVSDDCSVQKLNIPYEGKIKSTPAVYEKTLAFYSKSLSGSIVIVENAFTHEQKITSIPVQGIAYGSPSICSGQKNSSIVIGFITQSGIFTLYNLDGSIIENFQINLENIYYNNAVTDEECFYVLSSDAILTKVSKQGELLSIKIPNLTASEQMLTVYDYDGDGKTEIFVNADSNEIFAFTQNLEMIKNFPLAGRGAPVFADLNGDKRNECVTISMDNKLNAKKVLTK